jgi:hypothetical protein
VAAGALTSNKIDPTKSGVLMKGSVPPTWSGAFTYLSTMSSLTWSWSGLTIYRADGTTTNVPNGSVVVASLAASTTYYFYPYWDDVAGALEWVAGSAGGPAYAQSDKTNLAAQQQALQGRIPLSQGAVSAATTASGTGGGSGGGSGGCVRARRGADQGARHSGDRNVPVRRTFAMSRRGARRRKLDAHRPARRARC